MAAAPLRTPLRKGPKRHLSGLNPARQRLSEPPAGGPEALWRRPSTAVVEAATFESSITSLARTTESAACESGPCRLKIGLLKAVLEGPGGSRRLGAGQRREEDTEKNAEELSEISITTGDDF